MGQRVSGHAPCGDKAKNRSAPACSDKGYRKSGELNPGAPLPLGALADLPENSITLLRDFHLFFDDPNPMLIRQLKDLLRTGKSSSRTIAVLGCRLKLPPELERDFTVIEFALPGEPELRQVLAGIVESTKRATPSPEAAAALIDAARGMTPPKPRMPSPSR